MNQCGIGVLSLQIIDYVNFIVCALSIFGALLYKDKKWALFSIVTSISFFVAIYNHCELKVLDPERVFRYLFWVANDFTWICVLYLFWSRGKIHNEQYLIALIVAIVTISLNAIRYFDVHFIESVYYIDIYRNLIPTATSLLTLCCWLPYFRHIKRKLQWNT